MAEARIPPHSIEAEKAVLGALLTENDIYDSVSSIVGRSDFYRDAHRIIYEAIEISCAAVIVASIWSF